MLKKTVERADNHGDAIDGVVRDFTRVVEQETEAFESLLEALLAQQACILKGDADDVSQSNETVERMVVETKKLEKERQGKARVLSHCLEAEEELTLSQLIPLVEEKYASRLRDLKGVLHVLSEKIQDTHERNQYLLDHSLRFIDRCLRLLTEGRGNKMSYSRRGSVEVEETSLFSGVG